MWLRYFPRYVLKFEHRDVFLHKEFQIENRDRLGGELQVQWKTDSRLLS